MKPRTASPKETTIHPRHKMAGLSGTGGEVTVSVPGKLILSGEPSVVYGYPAVLTAVDKRCWVQVKTREKTGLVIRDEQFGTKAFTFAQLDRFVHDAQQAWQQFDQTNEIAKLRFVKQDPWGIIKLAWAQAGGGKSTKGLELTVRSQIPIGSGMGSSAALSVAVIGAVSQLVSGKLEKQKVNRLAFEVEKKIHGRPSGGDNTIVTFGGTIQFQKGQPPKAIKLTSQKRQSLWIVQTGVPQENTGEMVDLVRKRLAKQKLAKETKQTLADLGKATRKITTAFLNQDQDQLHKLVIENEHLLEKLGVVSPSTKALIRRLEQAGLAAKICGAGGVKKSSGIVLVLAKTKQPVLPSFKKKALTVFKAKINQEGVRVERPTI